MISRHDYPSPHHLHVELRNNLTWNLNFANIPHMILWLNLFLKSYMSSLIVRYSFSFKASLYLQVGSFHSSTCKETRAKVTMSTSYYIKKK